MYEKHRMKMGEWAKQLHFNAQQVFAAFGPS